MSFVTAPALTKTSQHFLIRMVPDPTKTFTDTQKLAQQDVISQISNAGKDLFEPNPAVKVDGSGNLKSRQLYNRNVSISDLTSAMQKYDIVMQLNLKGDTGSKSAMVTHEQLLTSSSVTSPSGTFALVRHGNYLRGIDVL
jgi:hypothetical protein